MAKAGKRVKKMEKSMTKMTKPELVKALSKTKVEDKSLAERIKYAVEMFAKDMTKVTKADLIDLATEALIPMPKPIEGALKPKAKAKAKPVSKDIEVEAEVETTEEAPAEKPKTAPKGKSKSKGKSEPKVEVETLPAVSNVGVDNLPQAKIFPAEIEIPELGKLIARVGEFTSYADIMQAIEEGKTLYFAAYWTKRQLKEYSYAMTKMVDPKTVKNGFPFDLDLLMAVLPCESMERVFAMSRYTEALFQFEGEDFQYIEDTDPRSGDKFRIRASAGMEFEIYSPADEAEETEEVEA